MIRKVEIRNFKGFGNEVVPTTPLTLLGGVNGSGKSSFLQALLLLGKYASARREPETVRLYDSPLQFGCQRDIQNCFNEDERFIRFALVGENPGESYAASLMLDNPDSDVISMRRVPYADEGVDDSDEDVARLITPLRNLRYISANRISPRQEHLYSSDRSANRNLGETGEYAVGYLEDYKDTPIRFEQLLFEDKTVPPLLGNQVDAWLTAISPGASVRTSKDERKNRAYLSVSFGGFDFRPQNVGFGISYILPLLVLILSASPGDLILLENPEAHIHPSGQAAFGKLLVKAARAGIQLFVETHSDHIVNGVRVAVKQGGLDLAHTASVVFFTREQTKEVGGLLSEFSKPNAFRIDENGECGDYPPGFLDEWTSQLTELL